MRAKTAGAVGAVSVGVLALVTTGCVDPNMTLLSGVTMQPTGCNTAQGGWAGCSNWDTVTFTFYNSIPSRATATYTGTKMPIGTGGSDRPFEIDGRTYIHVVFSAVAHDLRGRGTAQGAVYQQGMHKIAETEMLEDYEGLTHYVIGLNTTTTPGIKTVKAGKTFTVLVG